jgi:DNA-binding transcriptional MerR regulator
MGSEMLTVGDVARLCDVAAETVRIWERLGKLAAVRTRSGMRLFRRDDVERVARARATRGARRRGVAGRELAG